MVAIDMPAGPSEQLCIADKTSKIPYVVADLLSQSEHGVDSQVVGVFIGDLDLNAYKTEFEN
jgi:histidinol dehydrogenase